MFPSRVVLFSPHRPHLRLECGTQRKSTEETEKKLYTWTYWKPTFYAIDSPEKFTSFEEICGADPRPFAFPCFKEKIKNQRTVPPSDLWTFVIIRNVGYRCWPTLMQFKRNAQFKLKFQNDSFSALSWSLLLADVDGRPKDTSRQWTVE